MNSAQTTTKANWILAQIKVKISCQRHSYHCAAAPSKRLRVCHGWLLSKAIKGREEMTCSGKNFLLMCPVFPFVFPFMTHPIHYRTRRPQQSWTSGSCDVSGTRRWGLHELNENWPGFFFFSIAMKEGNSHVTLHDKNKLVWPRCGCCVRSLTQLTFLQLRIYK